MKLMGATLAASLLLSVNVHAEEENVSEDIATIEDGIDTLDDKVDALNDKCQDEELSEDISGVSDFIAYLSEQISTLTMKYTNELLTAERNRHSIINGLNKSVYANNNISENASYSDIVSKIKNIKYQGKMDVTLDGNDKFTLESGYYEGGTIDVSAIVEAVREEAYNAGKADGYKEGKEAGLKEGITEGIKSGREEGVNVGKEEGFNAGKEEGLKEGKEEGFNAGKEEGIKEGKEIAIAENKQTWIDAGKQQAINENKQAWINEGINVGKQQRYSKAQSISTRFGVYQDSTGYGYIRFDELSNIDGFSSISVTTDGRLNLSTFSVSGNVLTLGGYYDGWGTGYVNVSATAFQY